jgi:hypothetical protein
MKFVTRFPLSGNGTDFREFGYTGSSDDISGCWITVTLCVTGARHTMLYNEGSLHNNIREETKHTLLYQHLFHFSDDAMCFGPYIGPSLGVQ